jgi:hypothetical protein
VVRKKKESLVSMKFLREQQEEYGEYNLEEDFHDNSSYGNPILALLRVMDRNTMYL